MLDPLSQRQKSSACNAEGDEIVPGRSLIIMENRTVLRTLPWGSGVATHWILWINPGAARCWRAAKCDNVLKERRQSH